MATFTFSDPPTDTVSRLRLLCTDIDLSVTTGDREDWTALFSDEEYQEFYSLADNNLWRAAAMALRTIAVSKALLAKAFHIGDYSESATELDVARLLNDKAAEYDKMASQYSPYSGVQQFDHTVWALRRRTWSDELANR